MGDTGSKGGGGRWFEGGGGHSRWEGTLAPGMSHPAEGLTIYVPDGRILARQLTWPVINGC